MAGPHESEEYALRLRAVELVAQGRTMVEAAAIVGIHRRTVSRAVRLHAAGGEAALHSKQRGRKPLLSEAQIDALRATVEGHRPDELGLAGRQWTRAAAVALVERETGVRISEARAGKFLNEWGTPRLRGRPAVVAATREA